MITWEYTVIPVKTRIHSNHFEGSSKPVMEDVQNDLNSLGKEGWEQVKGVHALRFKCATFYAILL
jgi:hypothetical protein